MSGAAPPLVTHCAHLTRALLRRMRGWTPTTMVVIGGPILDASITLQCAVNDALLHRAQRRDELMRADRALTRLRVLIAASDEVPGLFSAGQRIELGAALTAIGRMLGGWRKQAAIHSPSAVEIH